MEDYIAADIGCNVEVVRGLEIELQEVYSQIKELFNPFGHPLMFRVKFIEEYRVLRGELEDGGYAIRKLW